MTSENFNKSCTASRKNGAEGPKKTPACNTGSHSAEPAKTTCNDPQNQGVKAVVSLDWIAFVIPPETFEKAKPAGYLDARQHIENFMNLLQIPFTHYEETEKGRLGWKRCFEFDGMGGAFVALGGQDGMVMVQLSGQSLKFYSELGWDVQEWARHMVNDLGAKCNRLDIAFDDRGGYLHYADIVKAAVEDKNIVSRYANKHDPGRAGSVTGENGWTLYFGRYEGKTLVRIYDKAKERQARGHELPEGTHWIRVEAVFRGERAALALVDWLESSFSEARAVALLRGLVDFRVNQDNKDPQRWPFVEWWQAFLGDVQAIHLGTAAKPPPSVESYLDYLDHTAAAALALVNNFYGPEAIAEIIGAGQARLGKRHTDALAISIARRAAAQAGDANAISAIGGA